MSSTSLKKKTRPGHSSNIVELRGIKKNYHLGSNTIEAIKRVDLSVQPGEFIGITGPSGSGKSTLMHIVGCLENPTEGNYLLNGRDVSNLSDNDLSALRANHIGFVFQSFSLIPQYTVFENVFSPFLYRNDSLKQAKKCCDVAIENVGLGGRRDHKPSQLSGGEIQRVAIARALASEPLLILADEPTGNLDTETGNTIIALFEKLNAQGHTLIVVTHDSQVASHCQSVYQLRDGRISKEAQST